MVKAFYFYSSARVSSIHPNFVKLSTHGSTLNMLIVVVRLQVCFVNACNAGVVLTFLWIEGRVTRFSFELSIVCAHLYLYI